MNKLINRSKLFLNRNGSTILTCIGGAGVVATTIMAVKATPKAMDLLEKAKNEKGEELTKLEVVKTAGPVYIPTIVTGAATIACIFGANILNKRQQATLMSAYALLDTKYKDHKKKVTELYGEDANSRITEEIAKDKRETSDIPGKIAKQLFYDEFSGRYFESTMEDVIKAQYAINRTLSVHGGASLNEWYEELDIEPTDYGQYLGWSYGMLMDCQWTPWLEFDHKQVMLDDESLECTIIVMSMEPMCDYEYY